MDTLSHADWLRLHEVTLDLHAASSLRDLAGRVLEGVRHLFPYDSGSLQDDRGGADKVPWTVGGKIVWQGDVKTGGQYGMRVMPAEGPDFLPLRPAWLAVSAEKHPHTSYYRRTTDGTARRLSDVVPMRRLRRTKFFNEISRPLGLTAQMTVYMPLSPGSTLMLAACRSGTDFSERERLLLDLLRSHVGLSWRRVLGAERTIDCRPASKLAVVGPPFGLTKREVEVLGWVSRGKTNRDIAIILKLSPLTVKLHVERILAKLGCETRTAAACLALGEMGMTAHRQNQTPGSAP